ncbi:amino acid ABC transporter permease [Alphaproteobacteria bacterium]|jgi:polar amino acid transport system permease protein|nr:amino acid ABC transporter permease [Alphaproteobacteria bacterium]
MDAFIDQFFNLDVMIKYLPDVIGGFWITLALALSVIATGLILGLLLACLRAFQWRVINLAIVLFVDLFRALPPLVLLIIGYFGLPYAGLALSGFTISWLCLSFVLAAFAEEIFWAGITSVQKGQWEASRSTGLSFGETLIYVVIPQALRMTIPPLTNRTIAITKNTALASVVAVQEMLTVAQTSLAYAANTSPLTLAAIGYLLVFFPLVILSRWVETRFAWKR